VRCWVRRVVALLARCCLARVTFCLGAVAVVDRYVIACTFVPCCIRLVAPLLLLLLPAVTLTRFTRGYITFHPIRCRYRCGSVVTLLRSLLDCCLHLPVWIAGRWFTAPYAFYVLVTVGLPLRGLRLDCPHTLTHTRLRLVGFTVYVWLRVAFARCTTVTFAFPTDCLCGCARWLRWLHVYVYVYVTFIWTHGCCLCVRARYAVAAYVTLVTRCRCGLVTVTRILRFATRSRTLRLPGLPFAVGWTFAVTVGYTPCTHALVCCCCCYVGLHLRCPTLRWTLRSAFVVYVALLPLPRFVCYVVALLRLLHCACAFLFGTLYVLRCPTRRFTHATPYTVCCVGWRRSPPLRPCLRAVYRYRCILFGQRYRRLVRSPCTLCVVRSVTGHNVVTVRLRRLTFRHAFDLLVVQRLLHAAGLPVVGCYSLVQFGSCCVTVCSVVTFASCYIRFSRALFTRLYATTRFRWFGPLWLHSLRFCVWLRFLRLLFFWFLLVFTFAFTVTRTRLPVADYTLPRVRAVVGYARLPVYGYVGFYVAPLVGWFVTVTRLPRCGYVTPRLDYVGCGYHFTVGWVTLLPVGWRYLQLLPRC